MFAVSALSVQNLNAQNEEKNSQSSTTAINESKPKDKTQVNEEQSPMKDSQKPTGKVTKIAKDQKDNDQEPKMREAQKPQGQQNNAKADKKDSNKPVDRTNKNISPKKIKNNGESVKNDAKSDKKDKEDPKVNPKPKKVKNNGEGVKNDSKSNKKEGNQEAQSESANKSKAGGSTNQLKKDEPKPNNVVRPKVKSTTGTNDGGKKPADR